MNGGTAILSDLRHTTEYAGVLRDQGISEVRHVPKHFSSLLATVMTFGALRPGAVIAQKART
jgi:hypothetical protein